MAELLYEVKREYRETIIEIEDTGIGMDPKGSRKYLAKVL